MIQLLIFLAVASLFLGACWAIKNVMDKDNL